MKEDEIRSANDTAASFHGRRNIFGNRNNLLLDVFGNDAKIPAKGTVKTALYPTPDFSKLSYTSHSRKYQVEVTRNVSKSWVSRNILLSILCILGFRADSLRHIRVFFFCSLRNYIF